MRNAFWIAISFNVFACLAFAGNFILIIDGKRHEIDLDVHEAVVLEGGQKIQVLLEKKDIIEFKTENFVFSHPNEVTPARSDVGDGIHQTIMATPLGTMVLIQEYVGMDPSGIVDFMLSELVKEEVDYGYEISKSDASKTLADGTELKGRRGLSKYQGDEYDRYVLSYGRRDSGLLIVTQVEKAAPKEDLDMIEQFWKSFSVSME